MTVYVVFMKGYYDDYPMDVCKDLEEAQALVRKYEQVDKLLDVFKPDRYSVRKGEIIPDSPDRCIIRKGEISPEPAAQG